MAEDHSVRGIISLIFKGSGAKDAKESLENIEKSGKKAAKGLTLAQQATDKLHKRLLAAFGGAVLLRFVKQSIGAFADWERQIGITRFEARRLGLDVQETERRVRGLTQGIQAQTGVLSSDTLPIFNKFLGLTGDVEQATLLLRAAVGAQEGGYKDLGIAANLLGSILQGEVIEPSKSLGLAFDQSRSAAEQQAEVLEQTIQKFLGLSEGIQDTRSELDSMNAKAAAVKLTLGEQLAPAIGFLNKMFGALIKAVQIFGSRIGTVISSVTQGFIGLGNVLAAAFDVKRMLSDPVGWLKDLTQAVGKEAKIQAAIIADGIAEERRIREGAKLETIQSKGQETVALAGLVATADTRSLATKQKRLDKEAEIERKAAAKLAEERAEFEESASDMLLSAKIAAAESGTQERLDLEIRALQVARDRALEEAKRLGIGEAEIKEAFRIAEAEAREEFREEQDEKEAQAAEDLAEFLNEQLLERLHDDFEALDEAGLERAEKAREILEFMMEEELKIAADLGADLAKVREKWNKRITRSDEEHAKLRRQIAIEDAIHQSQTAQFAAAEAVAAATTLFGESKALSIASAIIDTWGAVNAVLPNFPLAALVAAAGLANVIKIRSTEPSGSSAGSTTVTGPGFDDPIHDRLARMGGRRWAEDMLRNLNIGLSEGMLQSIAQRADSDDGGGGGTVPVHDDIDGDDAAHDGRPLQIFGNIYGGPRGLKELARELSQAERRDKRRNLR